MLAAAVGLSAAVASTPAAWAQCSSSSSPAPAAAPAVTSFSNQSFGTAPLPAYALQASGANGCDGVSTGSNDTPGGTGSPGQAGGSFTSTNTGLTIQGGQVIIFNGGVTGATWLATGGNGGAGGQSGPDITGLGISGNGGAGGAGGTVTIDFTGSVGSDASNAFPDVGLSVSAAGGTGGAGGPSTTAGGEPIDGGNGAAGGSGGQLSLIVNGIIVANDDGVVVSAEGGSGGNGGEGLTPMLLTLINHGGTAGNGGNGGTASVQLQSGSISNTAATGVFVAMQASADGLFGGAGGDADAGSGLFGGAGGNGGNGGTASALLSGGAQITVATQVQIANPPAGTALNPTGAILVTANGGLGGDGGFVGTQQNIRDGGGEGGDGGNGGSASASVLGSITYTAQEPSAFSAAHVPVVGGQAVLVESIGGSGGLGRAAANTIVGDGGDGGLAGAGGTASLTLGSATATGTILAEGPYTHGAVVQSIGGGGGGGGSTSLDLVGLGGLGNTGGDGGAVTVTSADALVRVGDVSGLGSSALIAQSIGGGGGTGGDASGVSVGAGLEIGGNGGRGGNGGPVTINLGQNSVFASLDEMGGDAILAQSIGGAGGNGGNASSSGAGIITLVIGGAGGNGGGGGAVQINTGALVTSYGDHAVGILAQSIGGGGGNGGSGVSFNAGVSLSSSVSVGGGGGAGGTGGNISLTNTGQVTTFGPDSSGLLMQSIGGGGGTGGTAEARAAALSPSQSFPAISVAVALGGSGGVGNSGGNITLSNSGLITTAGDMSMGVTAQSVGGGGGTAGDATAASVSESAAKGTSISVSVAVGGSGGVGGVGGTVNLSNAGLIATLGQDAYGVFAQSVGGGGGTGGTGDATAAANDAAQSFGASIGVGGKGGSGGDGGQVMLDNSGSILTTGDGAVGVFAQSVGGGGGNAGGGTGSAAGGKLAIAVGVGGSGGVGGNGNMVTLTNEGNIVTRGTNAAAVWAQSVGGGGGVAGKGGATAGGVTTLSNAQALFDVLSGGLNINQPVTNVTNKVLQVGQIGEDVKASIDELEQILPQPQAAQAGQADEDTGTQINVTVSVGGNGGAGGVGGQISLVNTGSVVTFGAMSDGVLAQSVGGGGGSGGAATSVTEASDDSQIQSAISVGGAGGEAGSGGPVTITNKQGGSILTQGVESFGIFAQSVGGGGGDAAMAGVTSGSFKSLSVAVGGNGGGSGDGGAVTVETGDGGGSITTTGKNGIGIFAQSLGGGGGLVRTITTDQTFDPSQLINNPQGRIADLQGLSLTFGGQNGSSGNGGAVQVTTSGAVTTSGLDAHGILAQSIGGGGGAVIGGQVFLTQAAGGSPLDVAPIGPGGASGNGGPVTVQLQSGTVITTSGDGAYGVIAQSIGGGGGFAGDPSGVDVHTLSPPTGFYVVGTGAAIKSNTGNGNTVSITAQDATITTTGNSAPAIFAQSIGGGGGVAVWNDANTGSVYSRGTAGGNGAGGTVIINLENSAVSATGLGSAGIFAQSDGTSRSPIIITVDAHSSVQGGMFDPLYFSDQSAQDASAIRLLGGTGNVVSNAGTISATNDPLTGGFAILADQPTKVVNTGTISGNISVPSAPGALSVVDNQAGAMLSAPTQINLGGGMLTNEGVLNIGGAGKVGQTTITGNLVQSGAGTLVVDINPVSSAADHLLINGQATLGGTIVPVVDSTGQAHSGPGIQAVILTATGGVTQNGLRVAPLSLVVQASVTAPDASDLALNYNVDYGATAALRSAGLLTPNREAIGHALNEIFANDAPRVAALADRLVEETSAQEVAATLDAVTGEAAADVQQVMFSAQDLFTNTIVHHLMGEDQSGSGSLTYSTASLDPVGPPANAAGVRVWVGGFGMSESLNGGTEGLGSLHSQIAGAQLGLDKWFDDSRMIGVSVGGGSINFDVADRDSQGNATSLNAGAYGMARFGDVYVSGILSYGNYATDLQRSGLAPALGISAVESGSLSDNILGGHIEAGWRQQFGTFALTPFASVEVDHLSQGAFTEKVTGDPAASGLAVHFSDAERTTVPLTVGARADKSFQVGGGHMLDMTAELAWVHDFNPDRSLTGAFVAAPNDPFTVLGLTASPNAAEVGMTAKLSLTSNVALRGSLTGRFSGVETAYGGFGGLEVTW